MEVPVTGLGHRGGKLLAKGAAPVQPAVDSQGPVALGPRCEPVETSIWYPLEM